MRKLGEVIKTLRLDAGLTQAQLGAQIGTDATNVGRVERGIQNLGSPDFHVDSFLAVYSLKTDFRVERTS